MQPIMLEPESVHLQTNGITLHAKISGPPEGPLILLLHGFPDFWYGWRKQIPPLAQAGYRVIVPDQRGYNLSEKPPAVKDYALDTLASDILGVIQWAGRQKAIIAGHDWGAVVAWRLAEKYPEVVEKLIITNVPHQAAFNRALRKPVWSQLGKSNYIFYFQIPFLPEWSFKQNRYALIRKALIHSSHPGTFQPENLEEYIKAWSQPGALSGGINWYRAMVRQTISQRKQIARHKVTVPTLILWGDQDVFLEPFLADWSMEWVEKGEVIHFADAGHWILQEKPVEISHAMLKFVQSNG
jgi:epoxide hydrolase 4